MSSGSAFQSLVDYVITRTEEKHQELLQKLIQLGEDMMERFQEVLQKIDEATNQQAAAAEGIVAIIQNLRDQLGSGGGGGMTPEQEAELLAQLELAQQKAQGMADRLNEIASNPDDPVP